VLEESARNGLKLQFLLVDHFIPPISIVGDKLLYEKMPEKKEKKITY
jgi:hypothetical protein